MRPIYLNQILYSLLELLRESIESLLKKQADESQFTQPFDGRRNNPVHRQQFTNLSLVRNSICTSDLIPLLLTCMQQQRINEHITILFYLHQEDEVITSRSPGSKYNIKSL